MPCYREKHIQIFEGKSVGHKLICHFGAIRATKILVEITESDGEHKITDINAYYAR